VGDRRTRARRRQQRRLRTRQPPAQPLPQPLPDLEIARWGRLAKAIKRRAAPAGTGTLTDRTRDGRRVIRTDLQRYACVYWVPTAVTRHTLPDTDAKWSRHETLADAEAAIQKHLDRGAVRAVVVDLQCKPDRGYITAGYTDSEIARDKRLAEEGSPAWRESERIEAKQRLAHGQSGSPIRSGRQTL
jgi:hypothetical protein